VGDVATSKKTSLVLALSTREQPLRWASLHNLMSAAIIEQDRQMFDLYQQALELLPLHPTAVVAYRHDASNGFRSFGDHERADRELAKARELAQQHSILL
jgi:hypothetical protein